MKTRGFLVLPGSVILLVAAVAFHLSKGLRMARIDHGDELWTLGAINRNFDQIVVFVLREDNHPPPLLPRGQGLVRSRGAFGPTGATALLRLRPVGG